MTQKIEFYSNDSEFDPNKSTLHARIIDMTTNEIIQLYDDLKSTHLKLLSLRKEKDDITVRERAMQKKLSLLKDEMRNIL